MIKIHTFILIVSGIVLVSLIFYGGFYFGQWQVKSDYSYFTEVAGFGVIKNIAADGSAITITSQTAEDKNFEVKTLPETKFYQLLGKGENENLEWKAIGFKDLQVNDEVYFSIQPLEGGSFNLIWLNVKVK